MNTANIGKTYSDNAETDKLDHSLDHQSNHNQKESQPNQTCDLKEIRYAGRTSNDSHLEQSESKPTSPELETNQLVQLNFSTFDGVSEKLKLLNHSYGIIISKVEVGNGYYVEFFDQKYVGNCSYVFKTEDLKPVEQVSFTVTFEPREYIALMNSFGSKTKLYDAIKQLLTGEKPT